MLALLLCAAVAPALGATTPWTLGDENTPACFNLANQDIPMPAGLDFKWVTKLPDVLDSSADLPVEYAVTIDHSVFWTNAANVARLGSSLAAYKQICDPSSPPNASLAPCTTSATANCCVWHSNLHSCRQTTGSACEPWVAPVNASLDTSCGGSSSADAKILVTHTGAQVGGVESYHQHLRLPTGSWVVISHIKIMNFQCAVGALRQSVAPAEASSQQVGVIVGVSVGVAVAVIAIVLVLALLKMRSAGANVRDVSNAPLGADGEMTTLMFTDIQDSTQLWGNYTVSTAVSLDLHHQVIRRAIAAHNGYEVKTVGDAFMIACKTAESAVAIARDIQIGLYAEKWPRCITEHYLDNQLEDVPERLEAAAAGAVFHGVRVRIGIHTGRPEVTFDEVAKGYDYYGPDVNLCARTEAAAQGGQIVLSPSTLDALAAANSAWAASLSVEIGHKGKTYLKGIDEPVELTEIRLVGLPFAREIPVKTAPEPQHHANTTTAFHPTHTVDSPKRPSPRVDFNDDRASVRSEAHYDIAELELALAARLFENMPLGKSVVSQKYFVKTISERRATLETLLKPLKPADQAVVLEKLTAGWRTTLYPAKRRDQTLLGLIARLIPAEIGSANAGGGLNSSQLMQEASDSLHSPLQ